MPKRISKAPKKKSKDLNQTAFAVVQKATELTEAKAPTFDKTTISQVMRQLGSKGGKIGGKRRLETMTQKERSEIALKAAKTRWAKRKTSE